VLRASFLVCATFSVLSTAVNLLHGAIFVRPVFAQAADNETLESLELQRLEAEAFAAALGKEQALNAYISSCKKCEFIREATVERDALRKTRAAADAEEKQFTSARGNIAALKRYVADCQVCAFARTAVQEIRQASDQFENARFQFEVCNNDHYAVDVAVAGRRDPTSEMWIAEGWWSVASGECKIIGTFAKGYVYYTAYSSKRPVFWPANADKSFCIPNDVFSILLYDGHECSGTKRGFAEANVVTSKHTWPLGTTAWRYFALADAPGTTSWGWSGAKLSKDDALRAAMSACRPRANNCRIASWVRDDLCLALATGNNSMGWASRTNQLEARNEALRQCRVNSVDCFVRQESCLP